MKHIRKTLQVNLKHEAEPLLDLSGMDPSGMETEEMPEKVLLMAILNRTISDVFKDHQRHSSYRKAWRAKKVNHGNMQGRFGNEHY